MKDKYPYTGTLHTPCETADLAPRTVTIIIPVYNQPEMLARCLDSVRRHTDKRHDVILVDNGSDDATRKVLSQSGHRVIRNKKNRGFAHACNQGLLAAKGDMACLLNTDTVVTDGWLEEMIAGMVGDVGVVGPTSNFASGPQGRDVSVVSSITPGAPDRQIDAVAKRCARRRGSYVTVPELCGFCMLIDMRVVAAIGGFDATAFGLGGGEETSFNERAMLMGWRLVWARGAYVHHVGHATMKEMIKTKEVPGMSAFDHFTECWEYSKQMRRCQRSVVVDIGYKPKPGPVLNILTRTHGREHFFYVCRESIESQVWGGTTCHIVAMEGRCNHYVLADSAFRARQVSQSSFPPEYRSYRRAKYNLYVNQLLAQVRDGWIMVLDDDDQLLRRNSLAILEPYLTDPDRLVVCRFAMNGLPYPRDENWGREFREGDVCAPCVIFHASHRDKAKWLGCYGGDYYAWSNLAQELPVVWVDAVIAGTQRADGLDSQGLATDREYRHWEPSCPI